MQNPWRKLNDKILCLSHVSYVFDSVLACAKSAHVFQKLTRFADFVSNNSSSDSLFHCVLKLSNSSTLSIACSTVLHCGHTFWTTHKWQSQMSMFNRKTTIPHAQVTWSHTLPLRTCHVHVTCYGDVHGNIPHKENGWLTCSHGNVIIFWTKQF